MTAARIEPLGDGALIVRFGDRVDAELNDAALAAAAALRAACLPGIGDIAPAYASVGIRYDIAAWAGVRGGDAFEALAARVADLLHAATAAPVHDPVDALEIPVCYGGEFGPDLDAVAAHARLSGAELIARHAGADYRVAMLGFMPGFAYLLGLDPALRMPRRASPRTRVPAGSVAIGGAQTGIYPSELPGGWQLIGRTPLRLFDSARAPPALLHPGQRVRFRPVGPAEFGIAR